MSGVSLVSLFAGAGGLDEGFRQAGFNVAFAADSDAAAVRTHSRNFPEAVSEQIDLARIDPREFASRIRKVVPPNESVGVLGGPPCQGFSRANVGSHAYDPRNRLVGRYLKLVSALDSAIGVEFAVFENVLGIRDQRHKRTYATILKGLEEIGLTVFEEELQALWFGVAQLRPRVFVVGIRNPTNSLEVRRPMSVRNATVRDAIGSLSAPAFFRRGIDPDTIPLHRNHWTMNPKSKRFAAPEKVSSSTRSFKRLRWDYPSPTVAYGHREIHVHPTGTRRLSVFEAMRLQGFPDRYVLEGNLSEQVTQVSNAVSPPVAFAIAQAISRSRSAQGE